MPSCEVRTIYLLDISRFSFNYLYLEVVVVEEVEVKVGKVCHLLLVPSRAGSPETALIFRGSKIMPGLAGSTYRLTPGGGKGDDKIEQIFHNFTSS